MSRRGISPAGPDPTLESHVEEIVRRLGRAELADLVGPALASADAQSGGGGLGIQNVRRGVGRAVLTGQGANLTISATSFTAIALQLDVVLSGRPLRVSLAGIASAGASGAVVLDVNLRGASITGIANGLAYLGTTAPGPISGEDFVMAPDPGPARLQVLAKRVTADGTLYVDANSRLVLLAEEL